MGKFRTKIDALGLNYRKEILIFSIGNVVVLLAAVGIPFLFDNMYLFVMAAPLLLAFNGWQLFRYKSIAANKEKSAREELVYLLSYFKIYLANGYNVYSAFREIMAFAGPELKEKLSELLAGIDEDKSVRPFIRFAKSFNLLAVEQLMVSIYQLVDEGNATNYLRQFEIIFSKLEDELSASLIERKRNALAGAAAFPLIGAAILIIVVTSGVIDVIGEMVNGI